MGDGSGPQPPAAVSPPAAIEPSIPCSRCGEPVPEGFDACWRCGTRLAESQLEREPGPDLETPMTLELEAMKAELRRLAAQPYRPSLRMEYASGVAGAVATLAWSSGLVGASGETTRRIFLAGRFWRLVLVHAVIVGAWVGVLALWRRWRASRRAAVPLR